MAYMTTSDGVKLFYEEESGSGRPIVFIHEFSGDYRSWETQVRCFARRYRCITFNARGYPPSDVPDSLDKYTQRRAVDDARDVMDHLKIDKAHVVGLSMGGFAALHFGIHYADRAAVHRRRWRRLRCRARGRPAQVPAGSRGRQPNASRTRGGGKSSHRLYGSGPGREQYEMKDAPRLSRNSSATRRAFVERRHRPSPARSVTEGCVGRRPSVGLVGKVTVPTLIIHGDEDWPCLGTSVMLKRAMPSASLVVFPKTGSTDQPRRAGPLQPGLCRTSLPRSRAAATCCATSARETSAVLLDTKR